MPIYEYTCQACGYGLEAIQKMSDPPLTTCPTCAKPSLKKRISVVGFQLKGTGWYKTDFKSNTKNGSAAVEETKAGSEAQSETKADATPNCGGGSCGCH